MYTTKNIRKPTASNKQNMLVQSLEHFFTHKTNHEQHMQQFLQLVEKGPVISLRVIDWFVTNYSREHDVKYMTVSPNDGHKRLFHVHESYKVQLKAYSKRQFDPFCRRQRILFHYETKNRDGKKEVQCVKTTIGQLNFFRWAIDNNVIQYIRKNSDNIEEEMRQFVRAQREEKRKHSLNEQSNGSGCINGIDGRSSALGSKSKTRRRMGGSSGSALHSPTATTSTGHHNNKTLRKGTIVTNRIHTTVFFS